MVSFSYTATDRYGAASLEKVVTVTVTGVNDKPVAANLFLTALLNTPASVTLAASDAEHDTLTYSIITPPLHGSYVISSASVVYTPATGYTGPDSFTYKANDGSLDSDPALVSITVRNANQAPNAPDQTFNVVEDTPTPILLLASDPDGGTLNYAIVDQPIHGTLSGTAPNLLYTPALNYAGDDDTFTYLANDGLAFTRLATVRLTFTPVNDAPVAENRLAATAEDTPVSIVLAATDVDVGDVITFEIVDEPDHGSLLVDGSNVNYTPHAKLFWQRQLHVPGQRCSIVFERGGGVYHDYARERRAGGQSRRCRDQ